MIHKKTPISFLIFIAVLTCGIILSQSSLIQAQEEAVVENIDVDIDADILTQTDSKELVRMAWESSSQKKLERLDKIVAHGLALFGEKAMEQQKQLSAFPKRGEEDGFKELNDVGTLLFVQAEAIMYYLGDKEQAVEKFQYAIDNYSWAQAWDPSRGNYWSIEEKSQASINVLTGKVEDDTREQAKTVVRTTPHLHSKGTQNIVDYSQFGEFLNVGTANYRYKMADPKGLSAAVGEGVYPNTGDIYKNPGYKKAKAEGRLEGNHWDFVNNDDLEAAYYKWFTAPEPWGVRLFYVGLIFEKAGMYHESIKAYHSLIVHYPKTIAYTYWQTPWYPAQVAIAKIRYIVRTHPELNLTDKWMNITVKNGFDNQTENDSIVTHPGKIVVKSFLDRFKEKFATKRKPIFGAVKRSLGEGKVRLVQYDNDHWQMLVDNEPYVIKAITYAPTKVGQTPDKGTLADWMIEDTDGNGQVDGPFDSWVDKNQNNVQDENEPVIGDFQLMKEMGVNTIRLYHQPHPLNKELLRTLYNDYGIRVIIGDFLGKYTLGSQAKWTEGTDYTNEEHRNNMMESVKAMVMEHKDEPYVLMWNLGNENNYGVACNADTKPAEYFKFADEVAVMIKELDPNHPISITNGDTLFLDVYGKNAPNIDIFSANVYRGNFGFGSFWQQVEGATGKPGLIAEYGAPAYAHHLSLEEGEIAQAKYHRGNWLDIQDNLGGTSRGVGNAVGGIIFEWMDEWWKNYEPYLHDRTSDAAGPFPGGYYYEEWFGIVGQGNGSQSPFLRHLKKTYFAYQEMWN